MLRPHTHFIQALRRLGKNDKIRAAKLGMAPRSVARLRAGRLPPQLALVAQHRDLLIALLLDAQTPEK